RPDPTEEDALLDSSESDQPRCYTIMWLTRDGKLTLRDPREMSRRPDRISKATYDALRRIVDASNNPSSSTSAEVATTSGESEEESTFSRSDHIECENFTSS